MSDLRTDPKNTIGSGVELNPTSLAAFENDNSTEVTGKGREPFGYANAQWLEVKAKIQPGDWVYPIEHRDPEREFGRGDYLFVRGDCVIGVINLWIT